jgi:hypothetical protein
MSEKMIEYLIELAKNNDDSETLDDYAQGQVDLAKHILYDMDIEVE